MQPPGTGGQAGGGGGGGEHCGCSAASGLNQAIAMSVARRVGVCCVTQSCGWVFFFFPHELSTGFMAHTEKEKERATENNN